MITIAAPRTFAGLKPVRSVPQFMTQYGAVLAKMSGSATYANPPIPYATATQHLAALAKAEQAVPRDGAAERDAKLAVCRSDVQLFKAFVQSLGDADPANAAALIEGAGMTASRWTPRPKQNLAARHGNVPGRVHVAARAAKRRASYHWQMGIGLTPGTWTDLPETLVANTTVDGLTPATIVSFRVRILTREGSSDWSAPVTIIVH
jgi:hypothetical protein